MEADKPQSVAVSLLPGSNTLRSPGVLPADVVFALTKHSLRHNMAIDDSWGLERWAANRKLAPLLLHTYATHLK